MFTSDFAAFHESERSSLRLDGHAVVADGILMSPHDVPGARTRLNAISPLTHLDTVAVLETAAWVLGALERPPIRPRFATLSGRRMNPRTPGVQPVEIDLTSSDVWDLGGLLMTSRERTIRDIARFIDDDAACHSMINNLANGRPEVLHRAHDALSHAKHVPHIRRATLRLRTHLADAINVVDPVDTTYGIQ